MQKLLALLAVAGLALVPACKKDEEEKGSPKAEPTDKASANAPTDEPADAPADKAADEPAGDAPNMLNKMANCPSAVDGSTTAVEDGEGVVVVTVTADEEAKITEIRKRASTLASLNDADSSEIKHSGKRTGGGGLGRCPVVLDNVEVSSEDVDQGVKITLKPKDESTLAELSKEAKARAEALEGDGHVHGSGTGGGGGGNRDPMKGDMTGTKEKAADEK